MPATLRKKKPWPARESLRLLRPYWNARANWPVVRSSSS